ncbi:hypothetical protein [Chamaesiphon polymorphus]|nr:hypothetical protein [Chamaesiphon polymorphus]
MELSPTMMAVSIAPWLPNLKYLQQWCQYGSSRAFDRMRRF